MPIAPTKAGGFEVSVCVRRVRLHRRLPPGATARDAKRLEAELTLAAERQATQRRPTIPGDPMLIEVMTLYVEHAAHLRSPDTAKHHAARIGRWCELYRASQARQCASHITADMLGHYKPATINRSLGTLKRGLRLAWERGRCAEDWSRDVKRLPEHNARETWLTVDEVRHLGSHGSKATEAAIWIALLTGCRRGEVLGLQRSDIGADSLTIRSGNTKTLKTRTVPIIPALRPWLKQIPLPINFHGLGTGFERARIAAGMPHVQYRDLRRSCGMILLSLDVPLDVIRDVLGHASIKTTETHYAHAIVDRQRTALKKLGRLVG
jgi:integrase